MTDRKQEESKFHNQREVDRRQLGEEKFQQKYSNKKWYSITRKSQAFVATLLQQNCPGKVALDYCCGLGNMSLELARNGATVYGIDISDESIKTAKELLVGAGYGHSAQHLVMDAENLEFPNNFFDLIICAGVLHHLDLNNAYRELSRVLKPSGRVICIEALGHNPVIQTYRRLTPQLRTAWEIDHILKRKDILLADRFFERVESWYFHLFSILAVPVRETFLFEPLLTSLEAIDALVLKLPFVRYMAWQTVFILNEPKKR